TDGHYPWKALRITSDKSPHNADELIKQMNINVTIFEGYGGYLKDNTNMTYVIINKYQLMKLKKVVARVHDRAFVVVHDVRDVFGGSFDWEVPKKTKKSVSHN